MRTIFYIILFAILMTSCKSDKELVKESFHNFKTAVLNNKGEEALTYAHRNLKEYFYYILDESRYADSSDVNSYSGKDKFLVLLTRHLCTKQEISKFNINTFMAFMIDQWSFGKEDIASLAIGNLDVDTEENRAKGRVLLDDQRTPFYVDFYKEDNLWKIDVSPSYAPITRGLRNMINDSGMTENEFMFRALEEFSGKMPDNKIWHHVLRKPIIKIRKRS